MDLRKSASRLTAKEKARLVAALIELKRTGHYDHLVHIHHRAMMEMNPDPAHGGPAFLPWHRYFVRHLELDLQQVDRRVTIPYWDWTWDRATTGTPWTADLMGGDGRRRDGQVMSGPFAYSTGDWPIVVKEYPREDPDFLTRALYLPSALPEKRNVRQILRRVPYDARPWNIGTDWMRSFRASLESFPHNLVHLWVGGNMAGAASPNDPVFFLHHAMVDRLWAKWQRLHPTERYRPAAGGPRGHNLDDRMWPWRREEPPVTPRSVLEHRDLGYRYDDEPHW
jgi:tyrosinase